MRIAELRIDLGEQRFEQVYNDAVAIVLLARARQGRNNRCFRWPRWRLEPIPAPRLRRLTSTFVSIATISPCRLSGMASREVAVLSWPREIGRILGSVDSGAA